MYFLDMLGDKTLYNDIFIFEVYTPGWNVRFLLLLMLMHNIYAGSIRLYSIYFLLFYFFSAMSMQVASVFKVYRFCCCYFYKCNINAGSIRFQGIVLNSYPPGGGGLNKSRLLGTDVAMRFSKFEIFSIFETISILIFLCIPRNRKNTPTPMG